LTSPSAFGIPFQVEFDCPGMFARRANGGAPTTLRMIELSQLASTWDASAAVRAAERKDVDARPAIAIDRHERLGYLLSTPASDYFLVDPSGMRVECCPGSEGDAAWQRVLVAQVLPLVATLRGLEPFHASAVTIGGRAVAIVAPSGAGKTAVALELVRRGATFLADDALALEADAAHGVIAHPGAAVAFVHDSSHSAGEVVGVSDKLHLAVESLDEPRPLAAVCFLRVEGSDAPAVRRLEVPDPTMLLGSTFNFYVKTPERLARQLDVCARAASAAAFFEVTRPPSSSPVEVAEAIERALAEVST
jgi:hypothetical protein